ncbi:amidase family protein [Mycoplasmopsis hyopharyngis]|uniref:amidase family protein n=1 Tax=Mycoplasmopsis hyopharyngis TaxID=29558 RepID=UPI003872FAEF
MKLKVLGDFQKAQKELLNDNNNAVSFVYPNANYNPTNENKTLDKAIFTIKQNFATKDAITNASSKILENFNPYYNATAVQKIIDSGAIPVAKVNCDELALGGTGTYSAYGLIHHKVDPNRYAGGSSSGSIATLSDNISFALASDTGDSVRLPASFWGKVGFKPSYGAISRYGLFSYASSLDTVAYFAHNVNDIALLSQTLYGVDQKDFTSLEVPINNIETKKPKKIALFDLGFLKPFVQSNYNKLINNLQKQEIEVDLIKPNEDLLFAIKPVYDIISYSEASSNLANLNGITFSKQENSNNWADIMTKSRSKHFGNMVQRRLTLGAYFLHSENQEEIFIKAQKVRRLIKEYFEKIQQKYDILIFPCSATEAPLFSSKEKYGYMDYILTGANLTGNPSLSLPWIKHKDLFVNLSIDSLIYTDQKLLSYALWLEEFLKEDSYE